MYLGPLNFPTGLPYYMGYDELWYKAFPGAFLATLIITWLLELFKGVPRRSQVLTSLIFAFISYSLYGQAVEQQQALAYARSKVDKAFVDAVKHHDMRVLLIIFLNVFMLDQHLIKLYASLQKRGLKIILSFMHICKPAREKKACDSLKNTTTYNADIPAKELLVSNQRAVLCRPY